MRISTPGRSPFMRLSSSANAVVRLSFHFGAMFAQLRTIIGPWLEAKTPTSSAMLRLRSCAACPDSPQKIFLGHAGHVEVEPQQVGVHQFREVGHVIAF